LNALGWLQAVSSEWGGYATLVPAGGARKAVREVADEASEQLGRQGARQAAQQLDDEWVRLYRAVSPEEVDDLMKSGRFRPHPEGLSTEGKWFTTTPEYAAAWAKKHLYRRKPYWVVEAKV
jgi:hypothetical protein